MPDLTHSTIPLPDATADDPRVGHLIHVVARDQGTEPGAVEIGEAESQPAAVIVGFPSDAGVVLNGGRQGAAGGPAAIRERLYRLTPDARNPGRFGALLRRTSDIGDLVLGERLESDQEALGETIAPFVKEGVVPIILGGGHETAFGHFLGHVFAGREVGVLNWDAHPDVRPLIDGRPHSGSPFRQIMTHLSGSCSRYTVAGLLPQHVSREHVDWITDREGEAIWRNDLSKKSVGDVYRSLETPTMVSFDLDAVDHAAAPGVSAPSANGIEPVLWLHAAYEAGRSPAVASVDVVELNPNFDPDGRTARLAALTVWTFLRGLSERTTG